MAEDGRIVYKVTCDTSNVEKEVSEGGKRAGSKFEEVMTGAARRVGEAFVEMAAKAVQGVEQIVKAGIEFNAKMEKYQTGLTTLLGSAEEAAAVMAQIREDAARTPFDVDSLTQANQMLISTGMSAGDARKDVLNLANAIAATGGGSAELSRMAANMQQVKNVGKATAMDIRQFAMAGINIYGLLADATGKTTEEVKDMEVSYELLSAALAKAAEEGGKYSGAMEAQSQTFNGRISTLKDNVMQLEGSLTEDLFAHLSGVALPMVMEWVATLLEAAQTGGIQGAWNAAKQIISKLVDTVIGQTPQVMNTGIDLLLNLVNGITKALPNLVNKGMELVQTLAKTLINRAPDIVSSGVKLLNSLVDGLLNNLPKLLSTGADLIIAFGKAIIQNSPQILEAGVKLLVALCEGITQRVGNLLRIGAELVSELFSVLTSGDWWKIGASWVQGMAEGFTAWWNDLVSQVSAAMSKLWNSVTHYFGTNSPSKKFIWLGEMNVKGMEKGFEDEEANLTRTVHDVFDTVPETALDASRINTETFEKSVSYNLTATGRTGDTTITVPLFLNGREIARATAWDMGQQLAWEEM